MQGWLLRFAHLNTAVALCREFDVVINSFRWVFCGRSRSYIGGKGVACILPVVTIMIDATRQKYTGMFFAQRSALEHCSRRHPVVTPVLLYLSQCLSQCPVKTGADLFAGTSSKRVIYRCCTAKYLIIVRLRH